jgi:uncharacterized membrane protein YhaH (DUF805 family)
MQGKFDEDNDDLSLWGYYVKCFIKKYGHFEGRARRKEYWGFWLFNFIIYAALFGVAYIGEITGFTPVIVLPVLYGLAVLFPTLAVLVRRLHDINRSGFHVLLFFIPFIGIIYMIVVTCTSGNPKANRYGPSPKPQSQPELF